jgi:hypothetical protein
MVAESIVNGSSSSRRSLLAAVLGALAAVVAQAVGRPIPARADNGDPVTAGQETTATGTTTVNTTSGYGLYGISSGTGQAAGLVGHATGDAVGVIGRSGSGGVVSAAAHTGVQGYSDVDADSAGVYGSSPLGAGVVADSVSGVGLQGTTQSSTNPGIRGRSLGDSTGVFGYSGLIPPPPAQAKTGVYGYAVQDVLARGVTGRSAAGRGVNGLATSGRGVHGQATSGIGGYFTTTSGTALQATGPVRFSSSGLATITLGSRNVTIFPGIDLTAGSKILAMLQTDPGGTTTVQRVAVDSVADSFTIYLTANAVRNVKVSWFVIS